MEEHLHTTSDHETLVTTLPWADLKEPSMRTRQLRLHDEAVPRLVAGVVESLPPTEWINPLTLDQATTTLVSIIQQNLVRNASGTLAKGKGVPWWTQDCEAAAKAHRRARRLGPATEEKHALRKAVRFAKRTYWQEQICNAKDARAIFKITRWRKRPSPFKSPPLAGQEGEIFDPEEKAEVLRKATLERRSAADDIDPKQVALAPRRVIRLPWGTTKEEVEHMVVNNLSTSPSTDGITVTLLRTL